MTIKEKTIREIEKLDNKSLMAVYDFLHTLNKGKKENLSNGNSPVIIRKLLKNIKGNIADDITLNRQNRI